MFGDNLKRLRISHGLSQDELAEKLNVSQKTVSSWETNRTEPNMGIVQQLADYFNVTTDEMIYGKVDTANKDTDIPDDFATPEKAVNWLMSRPILAAYGGKAVDEMTEDEKLRFARQILGILKAVSETIK